MSLSRIQSLRLAAVMEDCADKMDILGHTLTVQISRVPDNAVPHEKGRLIKLRRDCRYIRLQISKLHLELEESQSFNSMLQEVEEEERRLEAEQLQREAERDLERRKQALRRQQEEVRVKTERLKDLCQHHEDLKVLMHEHSLESANRRKIDEKDAELQLQLAQLLTSRDEKLLEDQQEQLLRQVKEEARVHGESEKYLQYKRQHLAQLLQQWRRRTDEMLREKEEQLCDVHRRRTENLDRLLEMRRTFREMEEVVLKDREEQESARRDAAKVKAAVQVQAWWRGCMVRRGGLPKPADEKPGKKNKDAKKKKK